MSSQYDNLNIIFDDLVELHDIYNPKWIYDLHIKSMKCHQNIIFECLNPTLPIDVINIIFNYLIININKEKKLWDICDTNIIKYLISTDKLTFNYIYYELKKPVYNYNSYSNCKITILNVCKILLTYSKSLINYLEKIVNKNSTTPNKKTTNLIELYKCIDERNKLLFIEIVCDFTNIINFHKTHLI